MRPIAADHDRTNVNAALSFMNEHEILTTGVLYEVQRPTLVGEMKAIAAKASAKGAPQKTDLLRAFM